MCLQLSGKHGRLYHTGEPLSMDMYTLPIIIGLVMGLTVTEVARHPQLCVDRCTVYRCLYRFAQTNRFRPRAKGACGERNGKIKLGKLEKLFIKLCLIQSARACHLMTTIPVTAHP